MWNKCYSLFVDMTCPLKAGNAARWKLAALLLPRTWEITDSMPTRAPRYAAQQELSAHLCVHKDPNFRATARALQKPPFSRSCHHCCARGHGKTRTRKQPLGCCYRRQLHPSFCSPPPALHRRHPRRPSRSCTMGSSPFRPKFGRQVLTLSLLLRPSSVSSSCAGLLLTIEVCCCVVNVSLCVFVWSGSLLPFSLVLPTASEIDWWSRRLFSAKQYKV